MKGNKEKDTQDKKMLDTQPHTGHLRCIPHLTLTSIFRRQRPLLLRTASAGPRSGQCSLSVSHCRHSTSLSLHSPFLRLIITLFSKLKKVRIREVNQLALGQPANKQHNWNLFPQLSETRKLAPATVLCQPDQQQVTQIKQNF